MDEWEVRVIDGKTVLLYHNNFSFHLRNEFLIRRKENFIDVYFSIEGPVQDGMFGGSV